MLKQSKSFGNIIESEITKFNRITFDKNDQTNNIKQRLKSIDSFKDWIKELIVKNYLIKSQQKPEKVGRPRQRVYWTEFGINVGSEFSYSHFSVVIKEFDYTAIVVPISSVKEDDPEWKSASNYIIPIGVLEDLPGNKKPCYAMINQIRTVSKSRLIDYLDKTTNQRIKMILDEEQTKLIFDSIKLLGEQPIKRKQKPSIEIIDNEKPA